MNFIACLLCLLLYELLVINHAFQSIFSSFFFFFLATKMKTPQSGVSHNPPQMDGVSGKLKEFFQRQM